MPRGNFAFSFVGEEIVSRKGDDRDDGTFEFKGHFLSTLEPQPYESWICPLPVLQFLSAHGNLVKGSARE